PYRGFRCRPDHYARRHGGAAPAPDMPAGRLGTGPLVSFARSGVNVRWGLAFQSLLELAEACDIPGRWACRTGVCHTCETGLVAGTVSYRPELLDAPADGNVLVCCCQPQGDVVIDLWRELANGAVTGPCNGAVIFLAHSRRDGRANRRARRL